MSDNRMPVALTIAGSDSSGGAGIQADLKTFSALGVYGASVITALTAKNTNGVSAIHLPPAEFILDQMKAVVSDLNIRAIKIGMLADEAIIHAVSKGLDEFFDGPVILDPVMVATSGDRLLRVDAEQALKQRLVPKAHLLTPNLAEAAHLLEQDIAKDEHEMQSQLEGLCKLGPHAVLLKGGHMTGSEAVDYFMTNNGAPARHAAERINTQNTHGTGCTLSSAVCAYIVKGFQLEEAVGHAKAYLTNALRSADKLKIGKGTGPVHHFYDFW